MGRVYQNVLGVLLPKGVSWSPQTGPSSIFRLKTACNIGFQQDTFNHLLVVGRTGSGKGVCSSSIGLHLHDRFNWKFIDFNDPDGNYENGYYGWPQSDPMMLDRFNDTFFYNEPHGYEFEMCYPAGTMKETPEFFTPFSISYRDLQSDDFRQFVRKNDVETKLRLRESIEESDDLPEFLKFVKKSVPGAYSLLETMVVEGFLSEEPTTLDYKRLANPKIIHSFSMASVIDRDVQRFTTSLVVRMIYDSRFNKGYAPCVFYVREAGTLGDTVSQLMATRGRHAGVHFLADTQRRTSMMDKTVGTQFGSKINFKIDASQLQETALEGGVPREIARSLVSAKQGVCYMNLEGADHALWPVCVSGPVTEYKKPNTDYFEHARALGTLFVSDSES